jgi:hypothetical protein
LGHQNDPLMWWSPAVVFTGALFHVPAEPGKVNPVIVATVVPSTFSTPSIGLLYDAKFTKLAVAVIVGTLAINSHFAAPPATWWA